MTHPKARFVFAVVLLVSLPAAAMAQRPGAAKEADFPKIAPDAAKDNLIRSVQPAYPPLAKAARIQGIVRVSIVINEQGDVKEANLISGHPMLAPAAIQAVRLWKYKPFQVKGKTSAIQTVLQISIPENLRQSDIDKEKAFQEAYWPNEREGRAALQKGDFATAQAKLELARGAAEGRGDEKWLELADVISMLGSVKAGQDQLEAAEQLYRQSLEIHLKHQRPDEAEVAGAQEDLAIVYYRQRQFEKAEPLLLQSVKTYEARFRDTDLPEPRAGYGRNIALGYLGLSQIALADGRMQESQDRCKQAVEYAEKWSKPSDKDIIFSRCPASSTNK